MVKNASLTYKLFTGNCKKRLKNISSSSYSIKVVLVQCCTHVFTTFLGPKPQLMNQTKIKCPLVDTLESGKWGMKLIHEEEETFIATFEVNVPPKALIGRLVIQRALFSNFMSFLAATCDEMKSFKDEKQKQIKFYIEIFD